MKVHALKASMTERCGPHNFVLLVTLLNIEMNIETVSKAFFFFFRYYYNLRTSSFGMKVRSNGFLEICT